MAPERKKSQTKFGISPSIFPPNAAYPHPNSVSDVSNVFIVPSLSPASNPSKKGEGGWGINARQMCLSPLAWIKGFFQVWCIPSRLDLCIFRDATWQSGQAALLLSFLCQTQAFVLWCQAWQMCSRAASTLKTHGRLKPLVFLANDIGETIPQFPKGL